MLTEDILIIKKKTYFLEILLRKNPNQDIIFNTYSIRRQDADGRKLNCLFSKLVGFGKWKLL